MVVFTDFENSEFPIRSLFRETLWEITVHRLGTPIPTVLRLWEPEQKELELGKLGMGITVVLRIV